MLLPIVLSSMNLIGKEQLVNEILEMNEESQQFGLVLTHHEAVQIFEARNRSLHQLGRIELSMGVSKSIIQSFCSSSYIKSEEYVPTISELNEIFYILKNETQDKIGDDELIRVMRDYFEGSCGGSMECLKSMLATFAEDFRKKQGQLDLNPKEE